MGMDAKFFIWAGIKIKDEDQLDNVLEILPKDCLDEDGQLNSECEFTIFNCSDQVCGFGIGLFYHDWDYDVVAFDAQEILNNSEHELAKVKAVLGDGFEYGIWCQSDFR